MFFKIRRFYLFHNKFEKAIYRENLGDYSKSLHYLFFALSLRLSSLKVYKAIVRVYKKDKKFLNALDFLSKAIFAYSFDSELFAMKADIHRKLKEYDDAILAYDSALKLNPKNILYYINRAQLKFYIQDLSGAINDFTSAIAYDEKNYVLYSQRAFCKFLLKKYESAIDDYTQAIKLNNNSAHLYFMRASIFKLVEKTELANNDLLNVEKIGFHQMEF